MADPQVVERDPHQPGHGSHRPAAEPRALGRGAREPPLRGGGRGARLPRRLRLARRQRPAPAAPDGAHLRLRAAVPARDGDDREPRRARARAARRTGHRDRERHGAPRRAHRDPLEPPASGRRARPARVGARRGREAPGRLRRARPADAHLREEPQGGRARAPLHRRAARRRLAPLARTAPATQQVSGARSSGGSPRASSSAFPRPTRSSSGSTSACSTR